MKVEDKPVQEYLSPTGVHPGRWIEAADVAEIERQLQLGAREGEVADWLAERLGFVDGLASPLQAVRSVAARLKSPEPPRGKAWSPAEVSRLRKLVAKGLDKTKIAAKLGRGVNSVSAKRLKLRKEKRKAV